MKKNIMIFILFMINFMFLNSCNYQQLDKKNVINIKPYTVMVYMNGSDLESEYQAGTSDLHEMMKIGSNQNLNIVIETGGTKRWHTLKIDESQNQRWKVNRYNLEHLENLGNRNMGRSDTLKDFITWSMKNFPAENYVLIFWNHGGGTIAGFGMDEQNNHDGLLLTEIRSALEKAYNETGEKFELIGFDACLMASLETAWTINPYADYFVASEALEPGFGWDYTPIFKSISDNSKLNGKELGKIIADTFSSDSVRNHVQNAITLSVTDLRYIEEVKSDFETLIKKTSQEINRPEIFNGISRSISRAESYGGQTEQEGYSNMVDLGDFSNNLYNQYPAESEKLINAINQAVVYQVKGEARKESNGLSFYFPYYGINNIDIEMPIYLNLEFSDTYEMFLRRYLGIALEDQSPTRIETNIQMTKGNPFEIAVVEEDREAIDHIYAVLGKYYDENEEKIHLFGVNNQTRYDVKTGKAQGDFDSKWLALNKHFVTICITEETEDYILYSIPVLLNGDKVNIKATWFKENKEKNYYEIIGAWPGTDNKLHIAKRELIDIKVGDKIAPIITVYDKNTKTKDTIIGEEFVIDNIPTLEEIKLPKGDYVYGFCIMDCSQNGCYSEFYPIDIK